MNKWEKIEDDHREFMLAALRAASARAKLMAADIETIGVSLKHKLICPDIAVKLMTDQGLMWMIDTLPESVGRIAQAEKTP